jgi:uncharacterized protein
LYVAPSTLTGAGRGVFAQHHIPAGTLIESCPVILLNHQKERARLRKTGLVNYYFLWGEDRSLPAICLGWGSVYNHSFTPNARFEKHIEEERMDFYALRDIRADEEITVNYNGNPDDTRRLLIPGIPHEAGGPVPSSMPRLVAGALRRVKLLLSRLF